MSGTANTIEFRENFWRVTLAQIFELLFKAQYLVFVFALLFLIDNVGSSYGALINDIGMNGLWEFLLYFPYVIILLLAGIFFLIVFLNILVHLTVVLIASSILLLGMGYALKFILPEVLGELFIPIYVVLLLIVIRNYIMKNLENLKFLFKPPTFSLKIDRDKRFLYTTNGEIFQILNNDSVILRRKTKGMKVYRFWSDTRNDTRSFIIWELIILVNHQEILLFSSEPYYRRIDFEDLRTESGNQIRGSYYWNWMDDAAEFIAENLNITRTEQTGETYLLLPEEQYEGYFKFYKSHQIPYGILQPDPKNRTLNIPDKAISKSPNLNEIRDNVEYELIQEGYRVRFKPRLKHQRKIIFSFCLITYLLFSQITLLIWGTLIRSQVIDDLINSEEVWFSLVILTSTSIGLIQYLKKSKIIDINQDQIIISDNLGPFYYNKRVLAFSEHLFLVKYEDQLEICNYTARIKLPGIYSQAEILDIQKSLSRTISLVRSLSEMFDFVLDSYRCYSCGTPITKNVEVCRNCDAIAPSCIICYINPRPEDKVVKYQCCSSYAHYSHAVSWNFKKQICPYCRFTNPTFSTVI